MAACVEQDPGATLRLRYADGFAGHQAAVEHKNENSRMDLQRGALEPGTKWDIGQGPALGNPVGHDGINTQRGWNGRSLKVLTLAAGILGQCRDCHVEPSQSSQAAQYKEGEADRVECRAKTNRKGNHSGRDTKRNLCKHAC